jgi:hypothetical protein
VCGSAVAEIGHLLAVGSIRRQGGGDERDVAGGGGDGGGDGDFDVPVYNGDDDELDDDGGGGKFSGFMARSGGLHAPGGRRLLIGEHWLLDATVAATMLQRLASLLVRGDGRAKHNAGTSAS